jgi:hypothetical protein
MSSRIWPWPCGCATLGRAIRAEDGVGVALDWIERAVGVRSRA